MMFPKELPPKLYTVPPDVTVRVSLFPAIRFAVTVSDGFARKSVRLPLYIPDSGETGLAVKVPLSALLPEPLVHGPDKLLVLTVPVAVIGVLQSPQIEPETVNDTDEPEIVPETKISQLCSHPGPMVEGVEFGLYMAEFA